MKIFTDESWIIASYGISHIEMMKLDLECTDNQQGQMVI
jgi:hypothetical protein